MPYRAYHVVLGIIGAVAVLTLVILHANPDRHARTGPRWKRRLINAGLLLLAAFGVGPAAGAGCSKKDPAKSGYAYGEDDGRRRARRAALGTDRLKTRRDRYVQTRRPSNAQKPKTPTVKPPPPTTAGLHQERNVPVPPKPPEPPKPQPVVVPANVAAPVALIIRIHDEANAIASGSKGRYPFDKAGKARVLKELTQAQTTCDNLRKAGQLHAPEAALMKQRLARLHTAVNGFRYRGFLASCYKPFARPPAATASVSRLNKRLPHLRRLAATGRLHRAVVKKILIGVKADLKVLEDKKQVAELGKPKERRSATALAKRVRKQVAQLDRQLAQPPSVRPGVKRTTQWKVFAKAWEHVTTLLDASVTTAQKRTGNQWIKSAREAVDDLVKSNLLTGDEALLLRVELTRLRYQLGRKRPSNTRARCYRPAPFHPWKNSRSRLEKRKAAMVGIVAAGRISKAVRDRVMPSIQQDISQVDQAANRKNRSLANLLNSGKRPKKKPADPFVVRMRKLVKQIKRLPTRK